MYRPREHQKQNSITILEHIISTIVPTTCEEYKGAHLCQLYPQAYLPTGISLAPIGPCMLEYCLLLYCYGGNTKNVLEMMHKMSQILKSCVCTRQKEDHFLKIKKSISALESPGYYPPIWVRNYPQRVPYRWGHCIRPYGLSPRRGGGGVCLHTLYIYIFLGLP